MGVRRLAVIVYGVVSLSLRSTHRADRKNEYAEIGCLGFWPYGLAEIDWPGLCPRLEEIDWS